MILSHVTPYPLCWPVGWDRTPNHHRRHAYSTFGHITFDRARRSLLDELRKLKTREVVLSTNQPLRLDGQPLAATRIIEDPGVAVYFTRVDGRQYAMARDAYIEMAANMRSLALAIEHLRGLERHGGDLITLLDPADRAKAINEAYRAKARVMAELNAARAEALRESGAS